MGTEVPTAYHVVGVFAFAFNITLTSELVCAVVAQTLLKAVFAPNKLQVIVWRYLVSQHGDRRQ